MPIYTIRKDFNSTPTCCDSMCNPNLYFNFQLATGTDTWISPIADESPCWVKVETTQPLMWGIVPQGETPPVPSTEQWNSSGWPGGLITPYQKHVLYFDISFDVNSELHFYNLGTSPAYIFAHIYGSQSD